MLPKTSFFRYKGTFGPDNLCPKYLNFGLYEKNNICKSHFYLFAAEQHGLVRV